MKKLLVTVLSIASLTPLLFAQPVSAGKVSVVSEVFPPRILPGGSGKLMLTLIIAPGWHINAFGKSGEDVLPTEFGWTPPPGITVTNTEYPRGEPVRVSFQKEQLIAYQDEVQIVVDFRVGDTVRPGTILLSGEVTVQACSEDLCLMPSDLEVSVPVEILRPIRQKKIRPRSTQAIRERGTNPGCRGFPLPDPVPGDIRNPGLPWTSRMSRTPGPCPGLSRG